MNGTWNQPAVDKWYNENLARGVSKSKLDAIVQQQQADYVIRQGVPASELQTSPIGLRAQTQEITTRGYTPPEEKKPAQVQKRELILNQAAPVLNRIIESAMKAPTGMRGAIKAKLGKIPGVAGGEAEYLARDVEGFARLIASAFASEVGVATDKDVARWKAIMPQPGDTYEERVRQSQKLINQIEEEAVAMGTKIPRSLIDAAKLLPVTQPTKKQEEAMPSSLQNILGLAPAAAGLATTFGVPIPGVRTAMGATAATRFQRMLEGQELSPLQKVLTSGGGIPVPVTGEEIGRAIPAGLLDLIFTGGTKLIKAGGPKGIIGKLRTTAAKEAQKISGGASTLKLAKKARAFLETNPEAQTPANLRLVEGLEKTKKIPVDDLLERTQVWNDAYKAGGGIAKGVKNKIYDILAKEGKKEIARVAPEVAKRTAQFRFLYQAPKTASKALWRAWQASILGRMLGIGR